VWVVSVITAGGGLSLTRVLRVADEMWVDGQFLSGKRVEGCQFLTVTYVGVARGRQRWWIRLPQDNFHRKEGPRPLSKLENVVCSGTSPPKRSLHGAPSRLEEIRMIGNPVTA
jgi:hypothetical protein